MTARRGGLVGFYDELAAFYDEDYAAAGYDHDVPFYLESARRTGGPVLELGCGSGRVTIELARAGVEVVGVDLSPGMLARLRERLEPEEPAVAARVELLEGDVRTVDAGRRFPLVVAPFRVVQHLLERRDQLAWLANVRRHLAPGGELVFDVFQPDYSMVAEPAHLMVDIERRDRQGRLVRRVSRSVHHPEEQCFEVTFEWHVGEPGDDEVAASVTTPVRWFTRYELENLLELAGFRLLDVWGDFAGTPFGEGAEDIVIRAGCV